MGQYPDQGAADGAYGSSLRYIYGWNQSPTTVPDPNSAGFAITTAVPVTSTIPGVEAQNWYFHVRAQDAAGWLAADATHSGPYWLD